MLYWTRQLMFDPLVHPFKIVPVFVTREQRGRERERETETETERQRQRDRDRETDTETERQRQSQRDREPERQRQRQRQRHQTCRSTMLSIQEYCSSNIVAILTIIRIRIRIRIRLRPQQPWYCHLTLIVVLVFDSSSDNVWSSLSRVTPDTIVCWLLFVSSKG